MNIMTQTKFKPRTLITVFGKYPGIVVADSPQFTPPDGYVRVEYAVPGGRVAAYVLVEDVSERK